MFPGPEIVRSSKDIGKTVDVTSVAQQLKKK